VARVAVPEVELRARLPEAPAAISFRERLLASGPVAVIGEVKRASPSKGDIALGIDAAEQAVRYAVAGAAGISILTEPKWFKGKLEDMGSARRALGPHPPAPSPSPAGPGEGETGGFSLARRPAILRKDFVVDEYQLLEARVHGADAVLLIVACLDDATLARLYAATVELGMEALVEVNNAAEMERAVAAGAEVIGINNRDLRSFNVDLGTTDRLAGMVPEGTVLAALSGISTRADVERFEKAGAQAVLVGEALMVAEDAGAKIRELLGPHPPAQASSSPTAAGEGETARGRSADSSVVARRSSPTPGAFI
jgi:anthranilate synthase/indole-3-glycerol phosphate synthase/phosphoribosylanthranilate isomerase